MGFKLTCSGNAVNYWRIRERQIRETEAKALQAIRAGLAEAENSGRSDKTPKQIKESFLKRKGK